MAFRSRSLSVLSYADGFTLWHYRTPDAQQDILEKGYFDPAAGMLRPGDHILANVNIQPLVGCGLALWVAVSAEGHVVVKQA